VPEELNCCRRLFEQAFEELRNEGREARLPSLGMMVEVPAAALPSRTLRQTSFPSAATTSSST
jgi:phosphotransferase system enzyme I (PtsI)